MLTTHYLEEAEELADRVAIIDHGHVVAMGTPSEIVERHGSGERLSVTASSELAEYLRKNSKMQVESDGGGKVTVRLKTKEDALMALGMIEESGLPWGDLAVRKDSLEDIFLTLVGPEGASEKEGS